MNIKVKTERQRQRQIKTDKETQRDTERHRKIPRVRETKAKNSLALLEYEISPNGSHLSLFP